MTQFQRQQARDEAGNLLLNENGEPQYGVDFYDVETGPIGSTVKLGAVTELYTYDAMNRVSTVVNQTLDINEQPLGQLIDTR